MTWPTKRSQKFLEIDISGKVKFINKGKILEGEIFGKPYYSIGIPSKKFYHVVAKDIVYDVPHDSIEEVDEKV